MVAVAFLSSSSSSHVFDRNNCTSKLLPKLRLTTLAKFFRVGADIFSRMETRSRRSRTGIRKESQGDAIFFFTRTDDEQDGWMNMSERVWMDEQTQRTDGWMDERTNAWTDERAQSGYVHTNERTSKRVNERAAGRRLDDRKIGNIAARTRREDLYPDSAEVGTVRSGSPRHDHVTRNALLAIRQTSGRFRPLHPLPRAHTVVESSTQSSVATG